MRKTYRYIFFDLDHTLWDFEKNSQYAISAIFKRFDFSSRETFTQHDMTRVFHEVNNWLWDRYNRGLIDKVELRNTRFNIVLRKLGLSAREIPEGIGAMYLEICPTQPHVIPHAHEILSYLKDKYTLHIITNGFDDVQHQKLYSAGIHHYFDQIITSDKSGSSKPQRSIFEYALAAAGASEDCSIMIGDNLGTDIIGAREASIDQVYFNASRSKHSESVTYEIQHLAELRNIL